MQDLTQYPDSAAPHGLLGNPVCSDHSAALALGDQRFTRSVVPWCGKHTSTRRGKGMA